MSKFRNTLGRLSARLSGSKPQRITARFSIDARIASYVMPLIERLIDETDDGETIRCAFAGWQHTERPPLCVYRGDKSTFRLDGPWQRTGRFSLPLGGLLLSPGVTAHLNPIEADELDGLIRQAIDEVIRQWVARFALQDRPPVPAEIERATADMYAREVIDEWLLRHELRQWSGPRDLDRNNGSEGGRDHD